MTKSTCPHSSMRLRLIPSGDNAASQDVRRTARPRLVSLWLKPGFAFSGRPLISACVPPSPASGCAVEFLFFRGAEGWVHLFEVLAVLCESAPAVGKPQIILPAREV